MYAERTEKTASKKDKTGIPGRMKKRFEHSSGFSFDDVRVHYNSEKPAQLRAHAYTQGNEVYVAPGQEKHLPHELGHVVQQKSDMVKPTGEIGGLPLNDDKAMENGADMIAENAENIEDLGGIPVQAKFKGDGIVQRAGTDTEETYNYFAGRVSGVSSVVSTAFGILGGIGALGGFLYSKHNARKHRYVEEVEKYADEVCNAQEEQIAAKEQADNLTDPADKTRANGEVKKLTTKIERNYKAALSKAHAMGEFEEVTKTRDFFSPIKEIKPSGSPPDILTEELLKKVRNESVWSALKRADDAYGKRIQLPQQNTRPRSQSLPAQPERPHPRPRRLSLPEQLHPRPRRQPQQNTPPPLSDSSDDNADVAD
ncbi:MAG: DUF4157 domain-containing protein [Oscillospiraceae bacterium]|nr:DUF4157 domain-containing protein [Oscillospiraceae bacterium]